MIVSLSLLKRIVKQHHIACSICGWNEGVVDIHHLKRGDDEVENLVAVCPNCHRKLHEDKKKKLIIEIKLNDTLKYILPYYKYNKRDFN